MLSLTASVDFLAAVPAAGEYFSLTKILSCLVAFVILARTMTWVDADLGRIHGPRTLWNSVVLVCGLLAVIILFFVPHFLVALLIFAAAGAAGVGSYILWRNSIVNLEDRVLTAEHIKKLLRGQGPKAEDKSQLMPDLDIAIQQLNGARVFAPEDDQLLQTGFQLAHYLLADALSQRATDVALLPAGQATRLLYRIDGVTTERQRLTGQDSNALISFVKFAAKLDPHEKRLPQQGQLAIKSGAGLTPVAVRSAGSSAGERMDIKVSGQDRELSMDDLRLPADQLKQVQALTGEQNGLVIVTGRRDCGVTTTVYALLRSHDAYVQHIHAIETKPLSEVENVTQHKPKRVEGKIDFTGTLRTVLRGDPGVVLVEPVKDAPTLKMMLQAAKTRKLYAGMSQGNTFSALTEVMTLAGDPKLLAQSLKGIIAQKLMRKLCPTCRQAYEPDPQLLKRLNLPANKIKQFYSPPTKPLVDEKGKPIICSTCKGTGYFGRVGAFETLVVTESVRELIEQDAGISQIKAACRKERMLYLQEQALRRVIEGLTSINEVVRISKKP